jgi:SecD/SecF fusion protein
MKTRVKKILSIVIIAVVVIGWYASCFGLGSINNLKDSLKYGLDIDGGVYVVLKADTGNMSDAKVKKVMDQTKEVLNRRVNAMGVSEASVSVEGKNRLRVEMPGVKDAKQAINRIGKTAKLRFTLADGTTIMTGSDVKNATASQDQENGGYKIVLKLSSAGQSKFADATEKAANGDVTATVQDHGTTVSNSSIVIWLDNDILTAPTARQRIDSSTCEITGGTGGMSKTEATEEAALIRGGSLPVSLHEVSSSVQTASIGANALNKSIVAGAIGLGLVFLFMIIAFNLLGVFADIALALYVLLVLWAMKMIGAVLTLPGIAGIILGVGMAVDANVIIFTRIKEEIGKGRSIRSAVDEGFRHALVTVLDSQITTLIATIVLYELGSTTVKGFAITLMISIIVSIFTAVVVTQVFVSTLADSRAAKYTFFGCHPDGSPRRWIKHQVHFIEKRKIFYCCSGAFIVLGLCFLIFHGFNYGIDFTGGTMIQMDMGHKVSTTEVKKAVSKYKLNPTIVYSGKGNKEIILRTGKSLKANQRDAVQKTLEQKFNRPSNSVISSEEFGPSIGSELRNNAIKSILIAALGMLIYIIFRFKSWKYGVAAIAGIGHDVLILVGVYAIFGITVDNPFVAAVLTIVGYSINDTIVIFDRVRENRHIMRGKPVMEVLDTSITQTLDRSLMTSITTEIAIIPLLFFVSSELAAFVLPLMVGVAVGTYSSICLCSPLFYEFNKREEASRYAQIAKNKKRIEAKKEEHKEEKKREEEAEKKREAQRAEQKQASLPEQSSAEKPKTKKKNKKNQQKHVSYKRKK